MADSCSHPRRAGSIFECDISRTSGEGSRYTVQLTLDICQDCGQIQVYCKSHRDVCSWLMSRQAEYGAGGNGASQGL